MATKKKKPQAPQAQPAAVKPKVRYLAGNIAFPSINGGMAVSGKVTPEIEQAVQDHCKKYNLDVDVFKKRYYSDVDFKAVQEKNREDFRKRKLGLK